MAQRSAHFTHAGERAEQPDDITTPVFATCVLGAGGIHLPLRGRPDDK